MCGTSKSREYIKNKKVTALSITGKVDGIQI